MRSADYRFAARHSFQINQAEAFAATWQRENLASLVARRDFWITESAQEVDVPAYAAPLSYLFQPFLVIAFSNRDQLHIRPFHQQTRQGRDQPVHSFVTFIRTPSANGQDYPSGWKMDRQRGHFLCR